MFTPAVRCPAIWRSGPPGVPQGSQGVSLPTLMPAPAVPNPLDLVSSAPVTHQPVIAVLSEHKATTLKPLRDSTRFSFFPRRCQLFPDFYDTLIQMYQGNFPWAQNWDIKVFGLSQKELSVFEHTLRYALGEERVGLAYQLIMSQSHPSAGYPAHLSRAPADRPPTRPLFLAPIAKTIERTI